MTSPWNGGVLSTAGGLVFQGNGAGEFVAYDARTGAELWSRFMDSGIVAPPITYSLGGEQYVAVPVGYGGPHAAYMAVRDALKRALPGRSEVELHWGLHFALAMAHHTIRDSERLTKLSDGQCDLDDVDGVIERVVSVAAMGLAAPAKPQPARARQLQ